MIRSVFAAVLTTVFVPMAAPVVAQTLEQPRISVGVGGGIANPLHGDFQFTAPTWHVSLRARPTKPVSVEFVYSEWRHKEETVRTNLTVQGPSGFLGRIGRFEERLERFMQSGGINVLLTYSPGRVSVWGGGGPAYMILGRKYRQTPSDCSGAVSCNEFTSDYSDGSFAVQFAAGTDVLITKRIAAFGQFGAMFPTQDPGSGHVAYTGGVRVVIW